MTNSNSRPILVFDLGKVLVDFDYSIAAKKIAAHSQKKSPEILQNFLASSPILAEYESGRLSRLEFVRAMHRVIGFDHGFGLEEFSRCFADIFTEMPETIALHAELRQHGYQTYILSNTNDLAVEHIRRNFPFFKDFDGYVLSYEVGGMKPEPKIYEALETMTDRRGADVVYIDDRPENIETGLKRGWRAVLHETSDKTRQALAEWKLVEALKQPDPV